MSLLHQHHILLMYHTPNDQKSVYFHIRHVVVPNLWAGVEKMRIFHNDLIKYALSTEIVLKPAVF